MPAATTHNEFAKEVLLLLGEDTDKITSTRLFYLGAQGPDLFFFSQGGILPGSLKAIGSKMHNTKIKEVMEFFLDYAKDNDYLMSYVYGYFCHYSLDSCAHPLINYSSKYRANKEESLIENHFRIEAYIDRLMLENQGKPLETYDVHYQLTLEKDEINLLAIMLQCMLETVYEEKIELSRIIQAINQTPFILSCLKPNFKFKMTLFETIENLAKSPHLVSTLLLYNDMSTYNDVLNEKHMTYFNPYEPALKYTTSFYDCYDNALKNAVSLIKEEAYNHPFELNFEGAHY